MKESKELTSVIIPRCYDSHVHWKSTGEILCQINLSHVTQVEDLKQIQKQIELDKESSKKYFRGIWLMGFGWDENKFTKNFYPHRKFLDEIFKDIPVAFSRADGHALWTNSKGLEVAKLNSNSQITNLKGGRVEYEAKSDSGNGNELSMTGIFVDKARELIEVYIPKISSKDLENYLLVGADEFYKNGFTHIRDLDGSEDIWNVAKKINDQNQLKLFVEMNFTFESMAEFKTTLNFCKVLKEEENKKNLKKNSFLNMNKKTNSNTNINLSLDSNLKPVGLKCYYDGALGSEGALLSSPYPSGKNGLVMYELAELEEIMVRTWSNGIPLSIHTLGDQAVERVVNLAVELKQKGVEGILNLEHCEVVKLETIKKMKALEIICHLQPSHFLTDQKWLKDKLGDNFKNAFPWRALEEGGIKFFFGSDSPIEPPLLSKTFQGVEQAFKSGIQKPAQSIWNYHVHPDGNWGTNCRTKFYSDGRIEVLT